MLLYDIYKILHEKDKSNFESEANSLYYIVTYVNNKVMLYEVEEYHFDGDDWGTIDVKHNIRNFKEIEVPIEEYVQAVCIFGNTMAHSHGREIMEYEYPYVSHRIEFKVGEL